MIVRPQAVGLTGAQATAELNKYVSLSELGSVYPALDVNSRVKMPPLQRITVATNFNDLTKGMGYAVDYVAGHTNAPATPYLASPSWFILLSRTGNGIIMQLAVAYSQEYMFGRVFNGSWSLWVPIFGKRTATNAAADGAGIEQFTGNWWGNKPIYMNTYRAIVSSTPATAQTVMFSNIDRILRIEGRLMELVGSKGYALAGGAYALTDSASQAYQQYPSLVYQSGTDIVLRTVAPWVNFELKAEVHYTRL